MGSLNILGLDQFAIMDRNCHLSRKRYEMGSWLLWNTITKS